MRTPWTTMRKTILCAKLVDAICEEHELKTVHMEKETSWTGQDLVDRISR
jgi:hypothetical protein